MIKNLDSRISQFSSPTDSITVTIVTICLNSKDTIARTIRSIINQKTPSIEYIVVDGGSIDGTQEIVRSFGDHVDIFVSEPDCGIADAFNKGIKLASGSIISIINSDDYLLPETLQKIVDFFNNHPDCQVVHGDILLYNRQDKLVKRVVPAERWWYPWRLVFFNHPATFVRHTAYIQYGLFDTNYRIAMDIDMFARWVSAGVNICYLPEPLVAMHYGGLSDRRPFEGYKEARQALILNGYPVFTVTLLYFIKCLLHYVGKWHAAVLVFLRN